MSDADNLNPTGDKDNCPPGGQGGNRRRYAQRGVKIVKRRYNYYGRRQENVTPTLDLGSWTRPPKQTTFTWTSVSAIVDNPACGDATAIPEDPLTNPVQEEPPQRTNALAPPATRGNQPSAVPTITSPPQVIPDSPDNGIPVLEPSQSSQNQDGEDPPSTLTTIREPSRPQPTNDESINEPPTDISNPTRPTSSSNPRPTGGGDQGDNPGDDPGDDDAGSGDPNDDDTTDKDTVDDDSIKIDPAKSDSIPRTASYVPVTTSYTTFMTYTSDGKLHTGHVVVVSTSISTSWPSSSITNTAIGSDETVGASGYEVTNDSSNKGPIIGGVVAGVILLVLAAFGAFYFMMMRKRQRERILNGDHEKPGPGILTY